MIKLENIEVLGWEHAIRGMRNPMNSWDKSDSSFKKDYLLNNQLTDITVPRLYIGEKDIDLMKRLRKAGTDHRKYLRMITVYIDITAPLYWWKEFDTYKVGTVANSCSTMHKIHAKEFTLDDFSFDHLIDRCEECEDFGICPFMADGYYGIWSSVDVMNVVIELLNECRAKYLETKDKRYWYNMIQILPSSYNQKRTVMLNYEVLNNIYKSRKYHKLDEWQEFCNWIETLPYAKELITGE